MHEILIADSEFRIIFWSEVKCYLPHVR